MRRTVIVAGIIFALLVITQVQASAQAGVIYGCVSNRSGALRIVSGPGECGSKEVAISWNQAGPQGPAGPSGADGQPGPAGPPGPGYLGVYDGNDTFLGYLVDMGDVQGNEQNRDNLKVFDPATSAYFWVVNRPQPFIRAESGCLRVFTSADCSGQVYLATLYPMCLHYCTFDNLYSVVDTNVLPVRGIDTIAKANDPPGTCVLGGTTMEYAYPVRYINFRLANVTLAYPITVRQVE